MEDFLVRVVGIPEEGLHVEDGSGLSRLNRASPDAFVRLLTYVAASKDGETFWSSLPEAGNRRGLGRMFGTPAAGNLRAKTGTINRVSALSGVVRGAGGEPILFSILSNNVPSTSTAKGVEDRIGIRLASFSRDWLPSPQEGMRARVVEYGEFGPRLAELAIVESR
jgi:D-alanyl-D-alanine carboxypeptidase/D-alanyl-D-alanine-endopeptidase (penicillin-binding protein 4)